jgi:hypothetical protein
MFPAAAVNVTVSGVVTAAAVAVKFALLAPAATVTDVGTEMAALLLPRLTTTPLVLAAALNETLQLSAVDPVRLLLAQSSPTMVMGGAAVPVPVNATVNVPLPEPLLAIVS